MLAVAGTIRIRSFKEIEKKERRKKKENWHKSVDRSAIKSCCLFKLYLL
jgi:hypothetical protein